MKKHGKTEAEGTGRSEESRLQRLLELRRLAYQSQTRWKTTLFQAELVFVTVCLPLCQGNTDRGFARSAILGSALTATLSMMFGIRSMILESCQLRDMESRERRRIRRGEPEVVEDVPAGATSSLSTALFVSLAFSSFVILYVFVGYADFFEMVYGYIKSWLQSRTQF